MRRKSSSLLGSVLAVFCLVQGILKTIIFLIFTHFCHEVLPIFAAAGVKIMSFRASIFIIVVLLKYLLVRVIDGLDSFLRRIGIFQRLPDVS